jgi:hypothetical protein
MNKAHAAIIALALGVAAVAGTFAALETTSIGAQAASGPSTESIAQRKARLAKAERKLDRAAKRRPPALPAIPSTVAVSGGRSSFGSSGPNPGPGGPAVSDDGEHHDELDDHGGDDDDHGDDDHGRHHGGDDDDHEDDD